MLRPFKRIRKALRLFRYKILLSFFAFIRVFVIWLFVYFYINYRQANLDRFTYHLINLQNQYEESNRNIQDFIINGHHDAAIYRGEKGEDIEQFEANLHTILTGLDEIKQEAGKNFVKISDSLEAIGQLHRQLMDTVAVLRQYYIARGFKESGAEGKLDTYARFLEDSTSMLNTDILMLRRYEKDFMLRSEQQYVNNFNTLIDAQLQKFASSPPTHAALLNYRRSFNEFAAYSQRLGINTGAGIYGSLQTIVHQLDGRYRRVNMAVAAEIAHLNYLFKIVLAATLVLLVAVSIYLSIVLSKGLTKDIMRLNKYVTAFVRSGFTEDASDHRPIQSKIAEIQGLIENFDYLKITLLQTLADLGKAIAEEKELSDNLQASKARLNNQLMLTSHQQSELIESRLMFTALLQHTDAAVIFLKADMEIMFHNGFASALLHGGDHEIMHGNHLDECLPEAMTQLFREHFRIALSGIETGFHHIMTLHGNTMNLRIDLFPIRNEERNVFAVVFWASEQQ